MRASWRANRSPAQRWTKPSSGISFEVAPSQVLHARAQAASTARRMASLMNVRGLRRKRYWKGPIAESWAQG